MLTCMEFAENMNESEDRIINCNTFNEDTSLDQILQFVTFERTWY